MLIAALQMHDGLQSRAICILCRRVVGAWAAGGWVLQGTLAWVTDQPYRPRFPACNGIQRALLIPYTVRSTAVAAPCVMALSAPLPAHLPTTLPWMRLGRCARCGR
jgi:hypothetical protein